MARYNTNDGSSGKVGNIVTYQMYGKSYVRSLPAQYRDKKSDKQLAQRQKMQLVSAFLGPYKEVLRMTFQNEAVGRSAFMASKSHNMLNAIGGDYPDQYIDYKKALVSIGSVSLPEEATVTKVTEGLLFEWNHSGQGHPSDTLFVIANRRNQYLTDFKLTGVERREESYLWKVDWAGKKEYDVWLVFRDCKERGFSNSRWMGFV